MFAPVTETPFAVLTLIAAPAVFTNASSLLALGTANRLARVVDRTRYLAHELRATTERDEATKMWFTHLGRLEKRGSLLVRGMRYFYGSIGAFAAASLVSILGASLAASQFRLPFAAIAGLSFVAASAGFAGLVVGCTLLVTETRLALLMVTEEAELARSWIKDK
jgi:hypothetical protein